MSSRVSTRRYLLVAVAAGVLSAAGAAALALLGPDTRVEQAAPAPAEDPHGVALPDTARVVLLSRAELPASSPGRMLNTRLESGSLPAEEVAAVVLTDSECTPDAVGISHCRNELSLADSRIVVARHAHRMAEVPCLSPGEHVLVRPV